MSFDFNKVNNSNMLDNHFSMDVDLRICYAYSNLNEEVANQGFKTYKNILKELQNIYNTIKTDRVYDSVNYKNIIYFSLYKKYFVDDFQKILKEISKIKNTVENIFVKYNVNPNYNRIAFIGNDIDIIDKIHINDFYYSIMSNFYHITFTHIIVREVKFTKPFIFLYKPLFDKCKIYQYYYPMRWNRLGCMFINTYNDKGEHISTLNSIKI